LAVLPILELPDPSLRKRAKKVKNIDDSVLRLAYDMIDTMRDAVGVGLAATQVGVHQRVIVVQLPGEDEASIFINPAISHREGEREVEEGCLSIPGYKGLITRSVSVRFRALDHTAMTVKVKADGLLAQALEHEVDHLNGILYIDHLESHQKLIPVSAEPEDGGSATEGEETGADGTSRRAETLGDLVIPASAGSEEAPASLRVR